MTSSGKLSVRERIRRIAKIEQVLKEFVQICQTNCRLIAENIIITQLLIKKGVLSQDEITEEILRIRKEQEEKRLANKDSANPPDSGIQSEGEGSDASDSGDSESRVFRDESGGGTTGGKSVEEQQRKDQP